MSSPPKNDSTSPGITAFDDHYCFVCGPDNPRGLKIKVKYFPEDMAAETELALSREFQGWADVIHGGILSTLLDEMMAHAVWHFAEAVRVRGVLTSSNGRRRTAAAEMTRSSDDRKIASAKSRFLLLEDRGGSETKTD